MLMSCQRTVEVKISVMLEWNLMMLYYKCKGYMIKYENTKGLILPRLRFHMKSKFCLKKVYFTDQGKGLLMT